MIENLPLHISIIFSLTTVLTFLFFLKASHHSKTISGIVLTWLLLQALIGLSGFYTVTDTLPPRFLLLILPPLLTILTLFLTPGGKNFIDRLDAKWLTYLHTVRVPVEMVLLWLFLNKQVPQLMTFEGRNFDILSGITAPVIAYMGYHKKRLGKGMLLAWNFICLVLLFNIVINAILSAPFPFQKFAFEQPNIGVLYFPFVWLPGFIVPLVLLSHLVCIRQLFRSINGN
jgi:hypothetical protein